MEFETKYAVAYFFPNPAFVQIYFEALANALDAGAREVVIHISTDAHIASERLEITISDDGQGFTDERFDRFARVKTPDDRYHKGLGRLVFLRYFSQVHVVSVFGGRKRTFTFSEAFRGDSETAEATASDRQGTVLRFDGFTGDRLWSFDDVTPALLKTKLIEHFIHRFLEMKIAGIRFRVTTELQLRAPNEQKKLFPDSQTITPADIPDFERRTIHDHGLDAFATISMSYMVRRGMGEQLLLTAASVDGRTIPMRLIEPTAIPPNCSAIFLFESELFSERSDSSRQRLLLPERVSEATLRRVLRREMSAVLNQMLPEIEQRNTETKRRFEERYPHLMGLFEEDTVGIIDRSEAIEIAQQRFLMTQREVLESDSLDEATFLKSLAVSSRTLTEYILYRQWIIERLRKISEQDKEESVHSLIVPRFKQFHQDGLMDQIYSNNAWLLDDKFMCFRTILSEARMREVISAITLSEDGIEEDGRPDISMIFSADPDREEKVDVVVVEIKRRVADDKETPYAATQLVKRARKLVDHCANIQRIWYFALIEIDEPLSQLLQDMNWTPLFSKGRVFYQDFPVKRADGVTVPTPTCLLSYDAVIKDAAARNHTFLEILKNDIRKAKAERGRDSAPASQP